MLKRTSTERSVPTAVLRRTYSIRRDANVAGMFWKSIEAADDPRTPESAISVSTPVIVGFTFVRWLAASSVSAHVTPGVAAAAWSEKSRIASFTWPASLCCTPSANTGMALT